MPAWHRAQVPQGQWEEGGWPHANKPPWPSRLGVSGRCQPGREGRLHEGSLCHPGLCCETLGELVRSGFDTRPRACGRCEPRTQTPTPSGRSRVIRDSLCPLVNGP